MARPRAFLADAVPWVADGVLPPTRDAHGEPLIRLQTLGAAIVQCGELRIAPSAGVLFALMLRLTHASAMRVPRDMLLESLWPEHSDVRRRASLRQALYKLRGFGVRVGLDGDVVQLDTAQIVRTFASERTATRFERDVITGHEPFGPFLPGYIAPTEALEEWVAIEREAVHADVRRVLVAQLRARRERADWGGAEALARWLLRFDPLHEDATLVVAECTMLAGAKAEAIAILDRYLADIGPGSGDIRLPAIQMRRRFVEATRGRLSFAPTERHFVGREGEITALTLAMRRARWREGSAVLLHAPPGMGKTRLTLEVGKVATIENVREVRASCCESDGLRILSVVLDMLPELMAQPGALGCEPESMATLRRLVPEPRSRRLIEATPTSDDDVPGVPDPVPAAGDAWSPADEAVPGLLSTERDRSLGSVLSREPFPMPSSVRRAIVDLVAAVSDERPLLIVVDNVHWIDSASWDVLADIMDRMSELRVVVLLTSRTPYACVVRPERVPTSLVVRELAPLDGDSSASLARLIGEDLSAPVSNALCDWFVDACEGNPLFLRSLVNHWIETGEAGGVPPTLQQVIEQRISKLTPDALRTLQVIALLGELASVERLELVLGVQLNPLLFSIEQLERLGALAHSTPSDVNCHELIGKSSVKKLSTLTAGAIHDRIAEVLVCEFRSTGTGLHLREIFDHWRASNNEAALTDFVMAELKSLVSCGNPTAGLALLDHVTCARPDAANEAPIVRAKARLRLNAGQYSKSLSVRNDTLELLANPVTSTVDQAEEALSIIDSAYRADPLADREVLLRAAFSVAQQTEFSSGTRLRAVEIALVIAANTCNPVLAADCYSLCGLDEEDLDLSAAARRVALLYHTVFGDAGISRRLAQQMVARAKREPLSTQRYHDLCRAGYALRFSAKLDDVVDALTLGYETAMSLQLPRLAQYAAWQLATVFADAGIDRSANHWDAILSSLFETDDDPVSSSFVVSHFCRRAIARRDLDDAHRCLVDHSRALPRLPAAVAASFATALEFGVALLDPNWVPADEQLQVACAKHAKSASCAPSDLFTSFLIRALIRKADRTTATCIAAGYLSNQRRERLAPSRELMEALSEIGMTWQESVNRTV